MFEQQHFLIWMFVKLIKTVTKRQQNEFELIRV